MSKNHVSHSKFSLSKFRFDIIGTRTQAYSWHAGTLLLPCGSAVCFFKLCAISKDIPHAKHSHGLHLQHYEDMKQKSKNKQSSKAVSVLESRKVL